MMVTTIRSVCTSILWTALASTLVACTTGLTPDGPTTGDVSVIATEQDHPTDVTVDDAHVYWVDQGTEDGGKLTGGSIIQAEPDGSGLTTLASGLSSPLHLIANASSLYWLDGASGNVMKLDENGGSPLVLVSGQTFGTVDYASNLALHFPFAVDATNVYWFSEDDQGTPRLTSANKVDGSALTFSAPLTSPTALSADSSGIYVVDGGQLERFDPDGGGPTIVASLDALVGAQNLVLDDDNAYWLWPGSEESEYRGATVMKAGKDGRDVVALTANQTGTLVSFAVDAKTVYFATTAADFSSGGLTVTLSSVPAVGGDASAVDAFVTQPITRSSALPFALAVREDAAFITSSATQPDEQASQGDLLRLGTH